MYMYYVVLGYSDLGEGLRQVGEQVVDMFRADGETYRGLRDALFGQFRFIELGVGGTGRVDDQRFDIGHVGQKREYLQAVDEAERFFTSSLDFEGEDGTGSFREVRFI